MPPPPQKENPLHNFLLNVLLPVIALSVLGKDGAKPWHIGPVWGMIIAIALPLGYGIWYFLRNRQTNAFSVIGLGSVLLTGGITLMAWRADGSISPHAAQMFALKEASIPLILGLCVILSHRTKTPLVRVFLFNPDLFDIPRIESALTEKNRWAEFNTLLWHAALAFGGSFIASTIMNYFLSLYFLNAVDTTAINAREQYNDAIGRQTFWGFFVIGLPVFAMLFGIMFTMIKRLEQMTGLDRDSLLAPR